jgi:predicted RNase H-like nuclease
MSHRKVQTAGRDERERLIRTVWPEQRERLWADVRGRGCAVNDLNDAFAVLWTARRIAEGRAETLSGAIELDDQGLRMEITV